MLLLLMNELDLSENITFIQNQHLQTDLDIDKIQNVIESYLKKSRNKISSELKLIVWKSQFNENNTKLHIGFNDYPIELITDFDTFCYASSPVDNIGLEKFNLKISLKNKDIQNIIDVLNETIQNNEKENIKSNDPFHFISHNSNKYDKTNLDYSELLKLFSTNLPKNVNKIDNFLLSPKQILQLLVNEIKKINTNKYYKHYITIDKNNIFSLIVNLEFENKVELRLTVDPELYPIVPPKLEYIKPNIKFELLFSINNLDILMLKNWSPTINLEYLITNLANRLEPIIKDYLIPNEIIVNELEHEMINLAVLLKDSIDNKIKFDIPIPKQNKINKGYWKSGTGYGSGNDSNNWSIEKYIKEKEYENIKLNEILININKLLDKSNLELINGSIFESYILNQTKGLTMLELDKNNNLYNNIFDILLNIIGLPISQNFINSIYDNIKNISEEIHEIIKDSNIEQYLLKLYNLSNLYQSKYKETIKEIVISSDIKEKYCEIMKNLQFANFEIPEYHQYSNNTQKINQSAIMRVLSEISSFKSGLPLNWESSIWVRVSKTNFNIFSFLISGPKDTPYENGLFEFHAYFPVDYPNSVPQVIIHTTNNGKVRFNPNLYANGKVCLSLLGTWAGQESEKWNPKTSTFIQVMISIQSLILVEQPCFNEPGWEKDINTPRGKLLSDNYNKDLHFNTIRLGMINMIKNPPIGFEQVVKTHFSMKKEEIINTCNLWEQNATKHKETIKNNNKELFKLLETFI